MHKNDTKEMITSDRLKVKIDDLVHTHAVNGRHPTHTQFFYSGAQHACIASYMAEDIYGIETARAVLALILSERHSVCIYSNLFRVFPDIVRDQDEICLAVFEAFGVDPKLIRCSKVHHICRAMLSVEHRDVFKPGVIPITLPDTDIEVVINKMTARQARTALSLRISELFDNIDFDHEASLRESAMVNIPGVLVNA